MLAIKLYDNSDSICILFGMMDRFDKPNIKRVIVAAIAKTMNRDELVNEISMPAICISAMLEISN
jgi:hypothetical protein